MSHDNLKIGPAEVDVTTPSHVAGVRQGNKPGSYGKQDGHNPDGTSTARRSTGVNHQGSEAILPEMPNISPP